MNYKRTNYVTFKNYWQPPDAKENYFVKYAIRGPPITFPNDEKENFFINYAIRGTMKVPGDFENQNLKMCGIW